MDYDVFNGDADGICALHQFRLVNPKETELITGVKRDVKLLKKINEVKNASITVFDISMDANKGNLKKLLDQGNEVIYFDHHFAGEIPNTQKLEAHIDTSPKTCTSLIVNKYLDNAFPLWAVTAAFGDNMQEAAKELAMVHKLDSEKVEMLSELGELINYNGYGSTPADLHFTPQELYYAIKDYEDPLEFYTASSAMEKLQNGYAQDMENALGREPIEENDTFRAFKFPFEAWSKRVAGVFSNKVAREEKDLAHLLLADNGDGTYLVSARAPMLRSMRSAR